MFFISTNPELNKPTECTCAKCGKRFIKPAWTGVYTKKPGQYYRYENPEDFGAVVLCGECAMEEMKADHVGMVLY